MNSHSKDKSLLRQGWKANFSHYQSSFALWSQEICRHIAIHPIFLKAERIGIFYPRDSEVDLLALWRQRPGVCGFPKTDSQTWNMNFYQVDSLESKHLAPGYGGILEPVQMVNKKLDNFQSCDLILVPGFAFDTVGGRVGSGKGVYDRFLATTGEKAHKWGVAFSPQVQSTPILAEAHDVRLEALVTEKGFVYF